MKMKLYIASDHAGYELKQFVKQFIWEMHLYVNVIDLGTENAEQSVDYPDYGFAVAQQVVDNTDAVGILICGSGIGISIAANRIKGARAALCANPLMAQLAREHNDANILVLGARMIDEKTAENCVDVFLTTNFAGGRHEGRIAKLDQIIKL